MAGRRRRDPGRPAHNDDHGAGDDVHDRRARHHDHGGSLGRAVGLARRPVSDGTFTVATPPWWTSALVAGDATAVAEQLFPADPAAAGEAVAMVEAFQRQEAVFIACDPTMDGRSVFSVHHVAGVGDVDLGFVVSENQRLPDVAGMTVTDEGRIASPIGEMARVRIDAHMADMKAERYFAVVGGDLWWLTYWSRAYGGDDSDLARWLALSFRPV